LAKRIDPAEKEEIKGLTLLEASQLVKLLEEKLGVSSAAAAKAALPDEHSPRVGDPAIVLKAGTVRGRVIDTRDLLAIYSREALTARLIRAINAPAYQIASAVRKAVMRATTMVDEAVEAPHIRALLGEVVSLGMFRPQEGDAGSKVIKTVVKLVDIGGRNALTSTVEFSVLAPDLRNIRHVTTFSGSVTEVGWQANDTSLIALSTGEGIQQLTVATKALAAADADFPGAVIDYQIYEFGSVVVSRIVHTGPSASEVARSLDWSLPRDLREFEVDDSK